MLLYALLYLTGHDGMSVDDIRDFRRLDSRTAGHPEYGQHPAIEATTGPPGQGFATAVGMAIAERNMAARFGKSLVDHRTWVIASDGDLMEGVSHETASLAGHLGLSKLAVLFDDNHVSADGDTMLSISDDTLKRFTACGWATKQVDGHDPAQINGALSFAVRSKKPTLIACRTVFSFGAPSKAGLATEHGIPLGAAEASGAKALLDWHERPFATPDGLKERWLAAGSRGAAARRSWLKRLARHNQRGEFERAMAGRLPDTWHDDVASLKLELSSSRPNIASRFSSLKCLEMLAPAMPELIGGSADLSGANLTLVNGMVAISARNYGGRYIHYGRREHGMAAAANGMALHGGVIPYVGTFLTFSDYLRPALRMAAMMRQRVIYVLTHDSIGLGENGPTDQPVEQLAGLRAIPNVHVLRPADAMETAECWELAIRRVEGPTVLALSRQALPAWRVDWGENLLRAGRLCARRSRGTAAGDDYRHRLGGRDRHGGPGEAGIGRHRRRCCVAAMLGIVCNAGPGLSGSGAGRHDPNRH